MDTKFEITLHSRWWQDPPLIQCRFDDTVLDEIALTQARTLRYTLAGSAGPHKFSVILLNKQESDTVVEQDLDKAVMVHSMAIEDFRFHSFMHSSQYRPDYSPGYREHCHSNNIHMPEIIHSNYIGWNGEWFLEMEFPIYTWIHKKENMGWIYGDTL